MKSIPALSICNNPHFSESKKVFIEGPPLKVYGQGECAGQLLMVIQSNNCHMEVLPAAYAVPYGGPSGSTFMISICDDSVPRGAPGHVLNLPFHKDASTLIQIFVRGALTTPENVDVESWKIWKDESSLLSGCRAACPPLSKALISESTTLEQVLPASTPQTQGLLDSACDIS